MSTTPRQLVDFANIINEHPALDEVRERIDRRLFNRFRSATPEERVIINSIIDAGNLFFNELSAVLDEARDLDKEENINS